MSRPARLLAALALTAGLGTVAAPPVSAASCATPWGSLPEQAAVLTAAEVAGVRAGQHPCFDRLVVDLGPGGLAGHSVSYVAQIAEDGSGRPVPTRGGAALQVVVGARAYDDAGRPTYLPVSPTEVVPVGGYRTFRQVVWAGSFEGQTTLGIGVRARLPFRVLVLPGPGTGSRLVVDVAHHW